MKLNSSSKSAQLVGKLSLWSAKHPALAIALVSLLALAINCYPIIFCGKSFVAPAVGLPMLYEAYPTLPGMTNADAVQAHGSDVGATLIWGVPVGFIQSRSIWEHGELPLWNRYSHAGDTLIGQAISLLGDPLQWIVIIGHGAALAYDIKFLLAKLLFAIGFGLLIRRLIGSLPLALIFAAMAPYCGAFYFVYNHPVFFVFSYAPWILLSALEFLDLQSRYSPRWGLVWLVVNVGCFNGGHIEPAVILIGALNFAALAFTLATNRGTIPTARVILRLGVGTLLFFGLTAPIWISFLAALPGAYTIHSEINVVQMRFASLLGAFDDIFFRLPGPFTAPAPGASLLVFVGCMYSFIRWRIHKNDAFFWINTAAILLWGGLIFGWVPSFVIAAVPLLNRVGHTQTDFSYLLIIHLTIQCAYGFKSLAAETSFRRAALGLLWVAVILAAVTLLYGFGFEHGNIRWEYFTLVVAGAFAAPFLFASLKSRSAISFSSFAIVILLGFIPLFRFGLYNFGDKSLLMIPGPRVRLDAPSPAIEAIKADHSAPFRVMGAQTILYGDYAAVYDLEGITSCEPLANNEFATLIRSFPGITPHTEWETELTNPVKAHALLNLLNIKYVLTPPTVEVQDGLGFRLVTRSDLGVLQNLNVWPRAFFTDQIVSIPSTKGFIDHLLKNENTPFAALTPDELAKQPELSAFHTNSTPTITPATNYNLLPNSTAFDIHASAAGVVCLTEGVGRDFTATANGERKTILTMNRAFKGIYLAKPGDYHIQFTYRPRYWRIACTLFWTSVGLTIIFALVNFFGKRKEMEPLPNPDIPTP